MTQTHLFPAGSWPDCSPAYEPEGLRIPDEDELPRPLRRANQGHLWGLCPSHGLVATVIDRLGLRVCPDCTR